MYTSIIIIIFKNLIIIISILTKINLYTLLCHVWIPYHFKLFQIFVILDMLEKSEYKYTSNGKGN